MQLTKAQDALARLKGFHPGATAGEDFIYFCASFCDSISGTAACDDLRRRADEFETLAGPGSPLDDIRSELCTLSGAGDQCQPNPQEESSPWCAIRVSLNFDDFRQRYGEKFLEPDVGAANGQRPLLPAQARNEQVFLRWWCAGEQTVHDPDWGRFNLFAAFAIAECTVQSKWEFHPVEFNDTIARFRDQLWAVWWHADRDRLFGCYLLAKCHDAVNTGAAECRKLLKNFCELDVQVKAAVEAAEDLCRLLAESESAAASDPAAEVRKPASQPQEHDAAAGAGRAARQVTISMGVASFVLQCEGREPFSFTPEANRLFAVFVHRAANGAATELVRWEAINEIIGSTGPEASSKQDQLLSKGFSLLNKHLNKWAAPPDGKDWIGAVKGKDGGRCLNASVKWLVDTDQPIIRELTRSSQSISGPLLSPPQGRPPYPGPRLQAPGAAEVGQTSPRRRGRRR
jgi:hypothetical protein